MINSSEFGKRLVIIMDYFQLSASAFADRINAQRSSISHLLSGRNKPSLDFVMKVVKEFKEVELYWLLNGKGTFPNNPSPISSNSDDTVEKNILTETTKTSQAKRNAVDSAGKVIERIVFFYKDGSFKEYNS